MLDLKSNTVVGVGEVMIEMAPVGDGLYRQGFAGDTFNTVWHLAQLLGANGQVAFATRVGTDALSDRFVAEAAQDGISTELIARDPDRAMGLYLIELQQAERSFHYWRTHSAARLLAESAAWLDHAFADAGLIHLSGITVAILSVPARQRLCAALAKARQAGSRVSFDPNIRPQLWSSQEEIRATLAQFLAVTDIALPSFDDEKANWGDATPEATLARFQAANVAEIVVKNGPGPATAFAEGEPFERTPAPVRALRDTTGAGDAFNAGYLAARMRGRDPRAAVAAGQMLAGQVIQHFGARLPKVDARALAI